MLHRISPPACGDRLEHILQFQRHLLAFACDLNTILPLTQQMLQVEFGASGTWLWEKLFTHEGKNSELHTAIMTLINHVHLHPDVSQPILNAFDHDIDFYNHLADDAYVFSYSNVLNEEAQKALLPLMVAFYEDLLASGFPKVVHGHPDNFDRDALVAAFWANNPQLEVCPACDGLRPDSIDLKVYADADHFLPKSKYPFLSVHHANLVPVCVGCNRSFKLSSDPLNGIPLSNSFHPYGRPAIEHIEVQTYRNPRGIKLIKINDRAGMPSPRVKSLNKVFKLEGRWGARLRYIVGRVRQDWATIGRMDLRRGQPLGLDAFREEIRLMLEEREQEIGQRGYCILQASYLRYVLSDDDEFQELFTQYMGQ